VAAPLDLLSLLIPADDARHEVLEAFIADRLVHEGAWKSRRESDGVESCRIVEHSSTRVRLCGKIWEISDQTLHTFYAELERDHASAQETRWALYFEVLTASPRQARNAADLIEAPEDGEWRVALSGQALVQDGVLLVTSTKERDS
jgi:hypothetical protein